MDTESELIKRRQETRDEILAWKEQILPVWIFNRLGKPFNPRGPGYWLSGIVLLNLLILIPWGLLGLVLKEFDIPTAVSVEGLLAVEIITFSTVIASISVQYIVDGLAHRIVEKIDNVNDLSKLLLWLKRSWSMQNMSVVVVPLCLFWVSVGIGTMNSRSGQFVGFGFFLTTVLCGFLAGLILYVYVWACLLISNLKDYQYEMNAFSPADSEILSDISDVVMKGIYMLAVFGAVITLIVTSSLFDQLTRNRLSIPPLAVGWTLIIIQFLLTRSTLSAINNRAKWTTLNRIRRKINALEASGDLSDKDTVERLFRLADVHKQIMSSKSATIDLKSFSTLFSQLMLPLLGLLLGNLDKVLKMLP